jgi:transcriptional regulator with XRE-family HTH domain
MATRERKNSVNDIERRKELADFLKTRRKRLSPMDVGLPPGVRRKTPGLRREEVAQLASVGVTWYTWLEQGRDIHVSQQILESLAQALQLSQVERAHLFALAQQPLMPALSMQREVVSPFLQRLLEQLEPGPAYITGRCWDLLAWNRAASEVLGDFQAVEEEQRNIVWFIFTNQEFRRRVVDWEGVAQRALAQFRVSCGQWPGDPRFADLIERLKQNSPEFRVWWPRHEIRGRLDGCKELIHPRVGRLLLEHTTFQVNEAPDLKVVVYLPAPGTDTAASIQRLLSGEPLTI